MDCKYCTRQKHCSDKDKPPKNCVRFIDFADSKMFSALDKVMRQNKGVYLSLG